jgi:hypothetical protein
VRALATLLLCSTAACFAQNTASPKVDVPIPEVDPGEAVIHRLTGAQYQNAIRDLVGADVVIPGPLEPDATFAGLISAGASKTTISAWGVEQYEAAAYEIASQALEEPRRSAIVRCTPASETDLACARETIAAFGRRAWRRPLEESEVAVLAQTATTAAGVFGAFDRGMQYALAAILQSPSFLFRIELGEPEGGGRRYTSLEMASRLSFLFWNTTPDETLLAAGESGALIDDAGLAAEIDRLLASPRARAGVRNFFTEMFELYLLDSLTKDPTIFTHYSSELGKAAREETLTMLEKLIFDADGDYRDIFTSERTWVDRRLAAIYNVRATSREEFGEVVLSREGGRRGILGQVSVLALRAHPVSSSATLRGKFVRTILLCDEVPPPPVDVNTALPEPSGTAVTLRDRVQEHLLNPNCATCHLQMDPIGLGLETFDGIGRGRELEHGARIEPSSDVDGAKFKDAWELGAILREHEKVPRCLVRSYYRYAIGNIEGPGEAEQLDALTAIFANEGHRVQALLRAIAISPGFRRTKEAQ